MIGAPDHGMPSSADEAAEIMQFLGIKEHTEEDCRFSAVIYSTLERTQPRKPGAVVVDGTTVFVLGTVGSDGWVRWRIPASDRRRILSEVSAGHRLYGDYTVHLEAPE